MKVKGCWGNEMKVIEADNLGKWIATLEDNTLIASGESIEEVKQIATEKGYDNPIIWQVPEHLGRLYF